MSKRMKAVVLAMIIFGLYVTLMVLMYITNAPAIMIKGTSIMSMFVLGATARDLVPVMIRG